MIQTYEFDREEHKKLPELRYGDRIFKINNRKSAVNAYEKIMEEASEEDKDYLTFKNFLGEEAAEIIKEDDLPYSATAELMAIVLGAATNQDPQKLMEAMGIKDSNNKKK